MSTLFSGEHPRLCATCRHAVERDDALFCGGKTPVEPEHHCFRYRYDPLKRRVPPPPELGRNYTPEDFKL